MSEPILIAQDLVKTYGEIQAVHGISLRVARAEVYGLLGPNGAGKTTIISMLIGLFPPTNGSIVVDGLDLETHTKGVARKIDNLCRGALLLGATERKQILDETNLKRVLRDLEGQIA